jgi:hypothetical protein
MFIHNLFFFLFCILIAQFILNEDTIFNVMEFFFAEKTRSVFHEGGVPGVVFFLRKKRLPENTCACLQSQSYLISIVNENKYLLTLSLPTC